MKQEEMEQEGALERRLGCEMCETGGWESGMGEGTHLEGQQDLGRWSPSSLGV